MDKKILPIIKIIGFIILIVTILMILIYKIFGLTYFGWLFSIIGPQTYTATFELNGADGLSEKTLSCVTDSTMTCKVKAPIITRNGALIIGWGYKPDQVSPSFIQNDEIVLEAKNTTFYALTKPRIEVSKVLEIDSLVVEFEKGLHYEKNIDLRIKFLEKLHERWPFMFKYYENLNVLTLESFSKFNDAHYDGVNHWGQNYIDIKEANSDYTIIHELAHALDFNCTKGLYRITYKVANVGIHRYDTDFGYDIIKLISETDDYDFIKLYNKYKNVSSNKRPLKDYSYVDEHEFFADALAYYYDFKYEKNYYNVVNDEIINAVEKLINNINSGIVCQNQVNQLFK